jgi:hypothetical protein
VVSMPSGPDTRHTHSTELYKWEDAARDTRFRFRGIAGGGFRCALDSARVSVWPRG